MAGVVALALVAASVAGCGRDGVHVDHVAVSEQDRAPCRALLDALPRTVDDRTRRTVTGSTYAAAWGDPAIVLRCGVSRPGSSRGDPCFTYDGLGWTIPASQADDLEKDLVMTLAFRSPVVEVRVPASYRPNAPGNEMADLDAAVRSHTTAHGRCS